ncbi:MAG: hypothetical protein ACI4VI_06045 [Acutalibacteraceae bacterium]
MKRVNIFCGHYGSGKTNIAINYAVYLKNQGLDVAIADIDIVNPYFRTKDSEDELRKKGIEVISLPFANTNVDLPALPAEVYSLVQNKSKYAVFDVGGDDRGAYALGRYVPSILEENNYNMFFVANFYRPLTQTAQEALEVIREIESACAIPFTGIINNSNLGEETTAEDILRTAKEAEKLSRISGLPLEMTTCDEKIDLDNTFKLKLQKKIF